MNQVASEPSNHIIDLLRDALNKGEDIKILFYSDDYLCSSDRYLAILGSAKRYLSQNITISNILGTSEKHIKIMPLNDNAPLKKRTRSTGRPVDELLWQLAFKLSSGKLINNCKKEDIVYLSQWPNFTRVARTPNALKIAALLAARPIHLDIASRLLAVPVEEVYQFYSAADMAGYTTRLSKAEKADEISTSLEQQPENEAPGVMKRLMDKLISS